MVLTSPHRYEEEINRRTSTENDFVILKKVRDGSGPSGGCGPWGLSRVKKSCGMLCDQGVDRVTTADSSLRVWPECQAFALKA